MTALNFFRAVTQASCLRAIAAVLAATLAVIIDPIFRFGDYRALLHVFPVAGAMKFSGVLTLVFLQVVALFYLILLIPRVFRTMALFIYVPERSFHLNPLTSFLRSTLHHTFETLREYDGPRDDLPTHHAAQRPFDSIIYIIDESVRGSHLSLNGYPRATTPFLQSLETRGLLKNFGICAAASSYCYISNAYLITGHNAFPDDGYRTARNPTIIDYAKKMGYETIFIDIDQCYLSSLVKSAKDGPVRSLDRWMTDQSFKERHIDLEITKDK